MLLRLASEDPRPLYEQIAAAIRREVAAGRLGPGDRLAPGREVAEALDVNLDTVQRAYRLLVKEGLVVSRVGRGSRIVDDLDEMDAERLALGEKVDRLLTDARRVGVDSSGVIELISRRSGPGRTGS